MVLCALRSSCVLHFSHLQCTFLCAASSVPSVWTHSRGIILENSFYRQGGYFRMWFYTPVSAQSLHSLCIASHAVSALQLMFLSYKGADPLSMSFRKWSWAPLQSQHLIFYQLLCPSILNSQPADIILRVPTQHLVGSRLSSL